MSNMTPIQRSFSYNPIQFNNNQSSSTTNTSTLKSHKSLNKLGRKKTVSFSNSISIINVDCWKKYNIDVSESGGCLAWGNNKRKEEREKEMARKKKEKEDGCTCTMF